MNFPSYHQPYSHRTRFSVVRSTTKLVKKSKIISQFKLVQNGISPPKPMIIRSKSLDKSSTTVAKHIGNKYKWIRTSLKKIEKPSYKLDRRKVSTPNLRNGRVNKRKPRASLSKCLVRIRGVRFQTHPNGKCLQRLTSDSDTTKSLSSSIAIKKVEDPIRTRANVLLQRSIQITNARYRIRNSKKKSTSLRNKKNCIYFNRFGKCHRGDKCPFIHDRTRIAVCTQFLNGRCKNSSCLYSHELTPGKVPTCSYFIKGACGQDNCPYAHSYVGHDAQLCEDFVQGFCGRGTECSKQHILLCPQFESLGQCPRGKQCHLTHRRKRTERKILQTKEQPIKIHDVPSPPLLPSIMPAYIPLNQEIEKKSPPLLELKLKPSFLS